MNQLKIAIYYGSNNYYAGVIPSLDITGIHMNAFSVNIII